MMMKKLFLILFTCVLMTLKGLTQDDELRTIPAVIPFLTIAPDSRAGGMGDVGVATSPDVSSQHWNPAKYAFIENKSGIMVSFTPWLRQLVNDINLAYISGYYQFDEQQTLSASLYYFSLGSVIFRQDVYDAGQSVKPNEFALDAAYTRLLSDNFSGALTLRFIRSDIAPSGGVGGEEYNAGTSFAANLSGYYHKDVDLNGKPGEFAWGINLSNLGTKVSYGEDKQGQFIPANFRTGSRLSMDIDDYNSIGFSLDLNKLLVPTPPEVDVDGNIIDGKETPKSIPLSWIRSFYDAPGGFKEELREIMISFGAEYWYQKQFAIRAGYFNEHETKGDRKFFAVGVGVKLNVLTVDYSYLITASNSNNALANTMRFSLSFQFN